MADSGVDEAIATAEERVPFDPYFSEHGPTEPSPSDAEEPLDPESSTASESQLETSDEAAPDGPVGWEKRQKADRRKGSITVDNIPHVPPNLDDYRPLFWKSLYVEANGFVQVDLINDLKPIKNLFSFPPSTIPFTNDYSVQDGGYILLGPSSRISARRTRFGASLYTPAPRFSQGTRLFFEMDFSGIDGAPNVRHAFVAWPNVILGRTDSVFKDSDAEPETVDPAGPNAIFGTKQNGLRFVLPIEDYNLAVSVENTGGIITPTGVSSTSDRLTSNLDYGMHLRGNEEWGHFQVSGIVRNLRTEDFGPRNQAFTGFGLALSGQVYTGEKDNHQFAVVYGNGIGSLISDLAGTNSEVGFNSQGQLGTQKAFGTYLAYQHWWDESSRSTLYGSYVDVGVRSGQPPTTYKRGTKVGLNFYRTFSKHLSWGTEYALGSRTNFDGESRSASRLQTMIRYRF